MFLINCLVVATAVLVHYEFLTRLSAAIPKLQIKHKYRIVFGVFGVLIAHMVEIWLFAVAYYLMHKAEGWGELTGNFNGSLLDCFYFSSTVYSTVGFGDIEPIGDLRFLTGVESLAGLVLITWSASFLVVEMQRYRDSH